MQNDRNDMINLNDLPIEVLLNIFSYLSPEVVSNIGSVSKFFKKAADDNIFWKEKFKKHFPHLFNTQQQNWYAAFRKAYDDEYKNYYDEHKDLPLQVRKLFSLIKESDIESLDKIEIPLKSLDERDRNGVSLLTWAQTINDQKVLEYFYKTAKRYYSKNDNVIDTKKRDIYGRTILYWAIACHQNYEQIFLLGLQGSKLDEKYFKNNYQPIHIAAKEGSLDVVQAFIKNKPELLNKVDALGQTPLVWAASNGHLSVVQYLLEQNGVNLNAASQIPDDTSNDGRTALHWAADHGHSEIVAALVKAGATATLTASMTQSQPIHIAAEKGYLDVVQALIENKPELLNQVDALGQTPLVWAASKGHLSVVQYLLEQNGVNLNAATEGADDYSKDGRTALHWAAGHGHSEIVAALVKAGATATLTAGTTQYQPIHIAAEKGYLNVVQTLIKNKSELLNQVDVFGQTPLLWAASKGHLSVVQYLLKQNGVNLDAATQGSSYYSKNGRTALYWAAECGHSEIVAALVKAGATATLTAAMTQYQAIHIAAEKGYLDVVQALIENKPELLNQVDAFGQTPLVWAAAKGHLSIVQYLLKQNGVNLNATTQGADDYSKNGRTALHWAADHGHSEIVAALVKAGATATLTASMTQSQPIHIAAEKGYLDVVQELIKNKPELLNQVDGFGQTPLMWAASNGHRHVVQYLLEQHGVNLNAASQGFNNKATNGKTALHWAAEHGHSEIVKILLKHGMMPDLVKPIDKSKLDQQAKAEIDLLEYIPKRTLQPKYKKSFTLFCHTFNFGFSKDKKLDAANALKDVVIYGADKHKLLPYKKELRNGELKSIYQSLKYRL